ncbi:MAG: NAD(P)/FAD-dependent oxidoreductase [bacterium]|nr:NAD(P)/FAD-dependent oxidoreductase [bacterium]
MSDSAAAGSPMTVDIGIIGAGPVGLYATFYAGLRGMSAIVFDSMPQPGGQLQALYPKKKIYDVPGFPAILAEELVNNLHEQSVRYKPEVRLNTRIDTLVPAGEGFALTTVHGDTLQVRSVLIAAGLGAFLPRKLDLQDAQKLEERGVYYVVHNPEQFHGKRLLIIGGGDSAIDWGLTLVPHAKELTLIHLMKKFQAHEMNVNELLNTKANVHVEYQLKTIHGDEHVEAATIVNNVTGEEKTIAVDAILCFIGFLTNLGPIKEWGLAIRGNGVVVDFDMSTNIPGIFAAGDIVYHPGKIRLISTGFSEAAIAVNNAKHYLNPKDKIQPGHSSNMKME